MGDDLNRLAQARPSGYTMIANGELTMTFKLIAVKGGGGFEIPYTSSAVALAKKQELAAKGYIAMVVPVVAPQISGVWS